MQKPLICSLPRSLRKRLIPALTAFATGAMLLGSLSAQTSASSNQSGQSTSAPSTKTTTSGAAGSGQASATAAKRPAPRTAAPLVLKTDKEKQSYAMGMNLGIGLHRQGMTLDPALVARGLRDAQTGGNTAMTEEQAHTAVQQFQSEVREESRSVVFA